MTRYGSRKDHGLLKKTSFLFLTSKNMVLETGDLFPPTLVITLTYFLLVLFYFISVVVCICVLMIVSLASKRVIEMQQEL